MFVGVILHGQAAWYQLERSWLSAACMALQHSKHASVS